MQVVDRCDYLPSLKCSALLHLPDLLLCLNKIHGMKREGLFLNKQTL